MYKLQWQVADKRWKETLPDYKEIAEKALKKIPDAHDEISILLTNDKEIHKLNKQFRGKDKPTNVLSFPNGEDGVLGDIVMSLDTLLIEAQNEKKTIANHYTHMLIHGVLHLLGYDHENDDDQQEMESLEIEILKSLSIPNPYK